MTRAARSVPLLAVVWLAAACEPKAAPPLVFDGATLIDGTGAPPAANARIVVHQGHVIAVGPAGQVPAPDGAEHHDLTGKWVIPGLIDVHAHVPEWSLPRFVAWGVTSVRALHDDSATAAAIFHLANLGGVTGPRVYSARSMVDGPSPTYRDAVEVADPAIARRAVDALALAGADWVKVYTHITPPLLRAIVDEATQFRLPIAAHLGRTDAVTAAQIGVRTIEHLSGVVEATVADPAGLFRAHERFFAGWNAAERTWATISDAALSRTAARLAETGVVLVPTLVVHETYASFDDTTALLAAVPMEDVPENVRQAWDLPDLIRRAGWTRSDYPAFRRSRPKQDFFLREFTAAGGTVVAGSDAANQLLVPGFALHQELERLVVAGFSAADALRAATGGAARALAADSIGRITRGSVADFVVLDADPLDDIRNTRRVFRVVLRGFPIDPTEVRRSW